jgi:hypothetical protein
MTSRVFEQLLVEQIEIFRNAFSTVSRTTFFDKDAKQLLHPGEYGGYREAICRDFLKFFTPGRFAISQGFLINNNDEISSQCDIIVYDVNSTPLLQNESRQRFFPVETVCVVGEVKSKLYKTELKEAVNKLANTNKIKENTHEPTILSAKKPHEYDPASYLDDQLFTFLICESLEFNLEGFSVGELYEDGLPHRHKHNMILSLRDGLLLYYYAPDNNYSPYPEVYPNRTVMELNHSMLKPTNDDELIHFKGFATYMFLSMEWPTILYPDITFYLGSRPGERLAGGLRQKM